MNYITISNLTCFSHANDFEVLEDVIGNLSQIKYDGEGGIALLRHEIALLGFYDRNEVPLDDISCGLFTYTFGWCIKQCCLTLLTTFIHSFNHLIRELGNALFCFDCKAFNHKILELCKSSDEYFAQFWQHFINLTFQFLENEVDWKFMSKIF